MDKRQDSEKKTTAEKSDDTAVWDLDEDEENRREAFEIYCGKHEEELEWVVEERQRRKEKLDKLEEMRERWQKEESERSLEERRQLEKLGRGGNQRE